MKRIKEIKCTKCKGMYNVWINDELLTTTNSKFYDQVQTIKMAINCFYRKYFGYNYYKGE